MRVRPPRVRITYDVHTNGAMEKLELPFIVGILADLQGALPEGVEPEPLTKRRMLDIDRDSFDDVMRNIGPGLPINTRLPGLEALHASSDPADSYLSFTALAGFGPLQLVHALPSLRKQYLARNAIRWLQSKAEASGPVSDQLELWLKFDPAADDAQIRAVRGELDAALNGAPLDQAGVAAVRTALMLLFPVLQAHAIASRKPDANIDNTPDQAAALAARTAALAALVPWALQPEGEGKRPVTSDDILDWGFYLLNALALPDTTDANKSAAGLVKLLAEDDVAEPLIDADKQRNAQRQVARAKLGLADAATAMAMAGPLGLALTGSDEALRNAAREQARFLAGLQRPVRAAEVDVPQHLEIEAVFGKYLNDCADADGRGCYLAMLQHLRTTTATTPLLGRELFSMIAKLRPNKVTSLPFIVHHLHFFMREIFAPWERDDSKLLDKKKQGVSAVIDQRVAAIDQGLSAALSSIMHMPSFRTLEASWRGLAHLVFNSETNNMLKLKVFNASKAELHKDLESAVEFDQSALFKKIYEAEYGTFGGYPYSLLVGDYEISGDGQDIDFIRKMAEVAAAAHAPFIAAASASLFGLEGFDALANPRSLGKIFESSAMTTWNEFRAMEDARYVTLVLPHTLLRLPYGDATRRNTTPCEGLNFEEHVAEGEGATLYSHDDPSVPVSYPKPDHANFLWGNAAYVLAERITNAFSLYGWTAAIRGAEGGGLVENLPLYSYTSDAGTTELFCPTEVTITDRREKELSDLGFMSLCHCKGTSTAAFFGGQTTNSPKSYFSPDANQNARLSAMLPYMLAASRFAHYIKVIMRKKVGSFLTRANAEQFLNNWIANYVLLDDNASQDVKAAFPLRAARVVVTEVAGEIGRYNATVFLKPHFQLEELSTSIRLVATLPA
ncbi:MAG: type VI secretion system contractile sheath large subunit [Pseudomonadota bacterium]